MKRLILTRGVPGSGKSYLADQLSRHYQAEGLHVATISSDDHLQSREGEYLWEGKMLFHSHKLVQLKLQLLLSQECPVIIIDNTHTRWSEIAEKAEMALRCGYDVIFKEPETSWKYDAQQCFERNKHGVPLESIQKMFERFEPTDSIQTKLEYLQKEIVIQNAIT